MHKIIKENMAYILLVLITVMIMNFIHRGATNEVFVDTFSFGSTITSIILSVIAIIYTFIDGEQSKLSGERIVIASEDINKNTAKLTPVVNKIETAINDLSKIDELKSILLNIERKNDEDIRKRGDEMKGSVKRDANEVNIEDINIKAVVSNFTMDIKSDCLFISLSKENEMKLEIDDFKKFHDKKMLNDDLPTIDIQANIMKTLNILNAFNLIKCIYVDGNIIVTEINEEFDRELRGAIPEPNMMADSPQVRYYGYIYEFYGYK